MLRDRLGEIDVVNAQCILALGHVYEARYAAGWWEDFAKMNRAEFERVALDLVGPQGRLGILRGIVAGVADAENG